VPFAQSSFSRAVGRPIPHPCRASTSFHQIPPHALEVLHRRSVFICNRFSINSASSICFVGHQCRSWSRSRPRRRTRSTSPDPHPRRHAPLGLQRACRSSVRRTRSYAPYASRDSTEGAISRSGNFARESRFNDAQGREPMAKKSSRGRKQDRARVAGGQKHEVSYVAKKTGRSASRVKKPRRKPDRAARRWRARWAADLQGLVRLSYPSQF
jgi:hypothetical protein